MPSSRRSRSSSGCSTGVGDGCCQRRRRCPRAEARARASVQERLDRLDERMERQRPGTVQAPTGEHACTVRGPRVPSSASRRLLPMPGSPDKNVTRPRPAEA